MRIRPRGRIRWDWHSASLTASWRNEWLDVPTAPAESNATNETPLRVFPAEFLLDSLSHQRRHGDAQKIFALFGIR